MPLIVGDIVVVLLLLPSLPPMTSVGDVEEENEPHVENQNVAVVADVVSLVTTHAQDQEMVALGSFDTLSPYHLI